MKIQYILACIVFIIGAAYHPAHGDMGAIVPVDDVFLEETVQRAIIAHDGFEQILILSTGLKTEEPVPVVRIIPFPAEPRVFEIEDDIFASLREISEKHRLRYLVFYRGETTEEPLTITDFITIGAHSITVVKANDADILVDWTIEFLEENGLPGYIPDPERFRDIVEGYIMRDIPYFVFDLVRMEDAEEEVHPVGYAFETRNFFYPVEISYLFDDFGGIELFIISNQGAVFAGLRDRWPTWSFGGMSTTAILGHDELEKLHPEIAALFGKRAILGAFSHWDFSAFEDDFHFHIPMWEVQPRERFFQIDEENRDRKLPENAEELQELLKQHLQ